MIANPFALKPGDVIHYTDGRAGQIGVEAIVLEVAPHGMHVQFEDRAASTYIAFSDPRWMKFIALPDGTNS